MFICDAQIVLTQRLLYIYLPLTKKFYIPLDKANWSQPKTEQSYIYTKA